MQRISTFTYRNRTNEYQNVPKTKPSKGGNKTTGSLKTLSQDPNNIRSSPKQTQTWFDIKVANIFKNHSFKPLSIKKLEDQGLLFESTKEGIDSAKNKMERQGITGIEIIKLASDEGHVQILYAKNPNEAKDPQLAVFIPGQHGAVTRHVDTEEVLANWKEGKSICLTSFRGYMGNPGEPDHKGQANDLVNILEYLQKHKRIAAKNTELYAHSMGCDTLTNALAIRTSHLADDVYKKIILRAPYTSMVDMIKHKMNVKPELWIFLPLMKKVIKSLSPLIMDSFANLKYLKAKYLRIEASEVDKKIPYKMSRAVYEELLRLTKTNTNISFVNHHSRFKMNHDTTCFYYLPEKRYRKQAA